MLDGILRLLHPFMPFVTEEIWQAIPHDGELLASAAWPRAKRSWVDAEAERQVEFLKQLVVAVRNLRVEIGLPPGRRVPLVVRGDRRAARADRAALRPDPSAGADRDAHPGARRLAAAGGGLGGGERDRGVPAARGPDRPRRRARSRLAREADKLLADLENSKKKLRNQDFLTKARAEVVAKEQQRLASARGDAREAATRPGQPAHRPAVASAVIHCAAVPAALDARRRARRPWTDATRRDRPHAPPPRQRLSTLPKASSRASTGSVPVWVVLGTLLVAALLRYREALRTPFNFEEIYVLFLARKGFHGMLATLAQDVEQPLHFIVTWAWRGLGGEGALWLKTVPMLCGLLPDPGDVPARPRDVRQVGGVLAPRWRWRSRPPTSTSRSRPTTTRCSGCSTRSRCGSRGAGSSAAGRPTACCT